MKKSLLSFFAVLLVLCSLLTGCLSSDNSSKRVVRTQIFERIISGDQIAQYVPYGADGLISQYNYFKFSYADGDTKPFYGEYVTAYIFDNAANAQKRYTSLYRTYQDRVVIIDNVVYLNEDHVLEGHELDYFDDYELTEQKYLDDGYVSIQEKIVENK